MATVKHLYTGHGDPNDNPDLHLADDQAGNHLYQDLNDAKSVWISGTYEGYEGRLHHAGWNRMFFASTLDVWEVELDSPAFEGQIGHAADGEMFVAMFDPQDRVLRWRSMGTSLGGWYQEP